MKKIEHKTFLENNKLDTKLLLQPIQEKIEIFDRMHKLLETVSDCEKGNLLEQLESLDLEILEDIDEEYADKLEFNEIEEALDEQPVLETVAPKKVTSKPVNDVAILDELVKIGRTQDIGRSTFKDLGIKTQLGWETVIGKYRVIRNSVFRYRYQISLK
jgi:regulator of replication initiation timing